MVQDGSASSFDAYPEAALLSCEVRERPLRYVQINSFYNGSTGTIMKRLHGELTNQGVDSYIFWGRRHDSISGHERCCATKIGYLSHGVITRLTDRMGFYSKHDTLRLLRALDEIDPDIVHLHNIHGYYVNIKLLFNWLANSRCQVRWTLHDCWAFTGHCAHFSYIGCSQWKTCCGSEGPCPQLDIYPKTYSKKNCSRNYEDKRRIFNLIPSDRMTLITPSNWLAGLVKDSFLSGYPIEVIPNEIDHSVFLPTASTFRRRYGIGDRFMVLGVASPWSERKGLGDFFRLAQDLDSDKFAVVLVGLTKEQIKLTPRGIVGIQRTDSPQELAGIYSTANVFFNPTVEDNYPTVNLEAEACGTPVITYDTGGCGETISRCDSRLVCSYEEALHYISVYENGFSSMV